MNNVYICVIFVLLFPHTKVLGQPFEIYVYINNFTSSDNSVQPDTLTKIRTNVGRELKNFLKGDGGFIKSGQFKGITFSTKTREFNIDELLIGQPYLIFKANVTYIKNAIYVIDIYYEGKQKGLERIDITNGFTIKLNHNEWNETIAIVGAITSNQPKEIEKNMKDLWNAGDTLSRKQVLALEKNLIDRKKISFLENLKHYQSLEKTIDSLQNINEGQEERQNFIPPLEQTIKRLNDTYSSFLKQYAKSNKDISLLKKRVDTLLYNSHLLLDELYIDRANSQNREYKYCIEKQRALCLGNDSTYLDTVNARTNIDTCIKIAFYICNKTELIEAIDSVINNIKQTLKLDITNFIATLEEQEKIFIEMNIKLIFWKKRRESINGYFSLKKGKSKKGRL